MKPSNKFIKRFTGLLIIFGLMCATGLALAVQPDQALGAAISGTYDSNSLPAVSDHSGSIVMPAAACSGGPVIDGVTLDECVDNTFTVGGSTKTVRVWYSKVVQTVQGVRDGTTYNLTHYINSDAEAQDVAQWGREAWERYWQVFGHHPYNNGCGDRINVQLEDGVGWGGIAYWASSGHCSIGIDAPMIRGGTGQDVVYHEFQHYLQYSYDSGCYGFLKPNYDSGSAAGDAEFVEGYADVAMDTVDTALDLVLFNNIVHDYDPYKSFYDKDYWDVFNKYFTEQLGTLYSPTDPQWHFDAVRRHYEMCDAQDTLYVLDDLVPSLDPSLSEEELFLNFFAANWAKDWADPATQPELVYFDDDTGPSYGSITLYKDVNISSGTQSWVGETTPDDWAARYYQVKPQSGCLFVTANVDGAAGAHLGINLMAADTSAPSSVNRTAWIGEDLSRTYPGYGTYDRIAAVVNAFAHTASYDVSFTCATPTLEIQEPRQTNFALVGDPASPIAFLARFKVTSDGVPVRGLTEALFSADAAGDAVSIVPGSLSQVGEDYWAIMVPPIKPAGTTFVNFRVCLSGTICDTETNALLYVAPGNTDFALVFDGSGSMSTEDVPGEGTRLENAQKAGTVLADLLRIGDRILVTDFSAHDNPPGCGLPYGDGNCALDIITRLARTNVVDPASNAIAAVKTAIANLTAREWTPIGAALQDAQGKLTAAPGNDNPKHLILLSDGDENVNPLYATIKDDLVASGVVVDTIRFSADAPGALLAQIAADTGGSYRYVPTTSGTQETSLLANQLAQMGIPSNQVSQVIKTPEQSQAELVEQLAQLGAPAELTSQLAAITLPGPLGLDDVYDYYETRGQNAARLAHNNFTGFEYTRWTTPTLVYVDESVNSLRIVVASKQEDYNDQCSYDRRVEIAMPTVSPRPDWIPVSPPDATTPLSWDIRHSLYDDVVIIPNPQEGVWQVRSMMYFTICAGEAASSGEVAPDLADFDVMINSSAESTFQLVGRFLPPIVNNQGMAGDYVPIVATLLNRTGAIPGAIVGGYIEKPGGGVDWFILWDDGLHNDGGAGDGVYGNEYRTAWFSGNYNVRMAAYFLDPADPSQVMVREWNGGFFLNAAPDGDADLMPDPWEDLCGLNSGPNGGVLDDKDQDGLLNGWEFVYGTIPCQADTDQGGERDGSEVNGGRNPLWAPDDLVRKLGHISIIALNDMVRIQWTHALSYTTMIAWVSTNEGEQGTPVDMGNSGIFTDTDVMNDISYFIRLTGVNGTAIGDYSDPINVTPKADPNAPSGVIEINHGAPQTSSKNVTLSLSSLDTPLDGLADPVSSIPGGPLALQYNEVSGNIQMRVSNDPSFAGAAWVPLQAEIPWTLAGGPAGTYVVFAQFMDGAGNLSFVVHDMIEYIPPGNIFLPIINK